MSDKIYSAPFLDNFRDGLQKADTFVMWFFAERLGIADLGRHETGRVIFLFSESVQNGSIARFTGETDPLASQKALALANLAGVDAATTYNIMYALYNGASLGVEGCADALTGNVVSAVDRLEYQGIGAVVSKTVSGAIETVEDAVGIPREAITIAIIVAIVFGVYILLKKLKKL